MKQHSRHSPEYLDSIIILTIDSFFSCIELLAFVDIFATCITPPVH